jgi:hypothetical protein
MIPQSKTCGERGRTIENRKDSAKRADAGRRGHPMTRQIGALGESRKSEIIGRRL